MLNQIIQLWETYHLIQQKLEINRFQILELIISGQSYSSFPNEQDQIQQRLSDVELFLLA